MPDMQRDEDLERFMEGRGWMFLPTGPNEWQWMLSTPTGKIVGQQGDSEWQADLAEYRHRVPGLRLRRVLKDWTLCGIIGVAGGSALGAVLSYLLS